MRIEKASAAAVKQVALRMRERDFAEFSAVSAATSRDNLAFHLAAAYGVRDDVMVAFDGREPVCVGGTLETWPNVISLLFFATDDFPRIALPVTRFIRRLFKQYEAAGVHRIQAVSLDGYVETHNWLRTLGLSPETGPLRAYGRHGEDFVQFSRLKGGGTSACPDDGRFSRTSDATPLRSGGGA